MSRAPVDDERVTRRRSRMMMMMWRSVMRELSADNIGMVGSVVMGSGGAGVGKRGEGYFLKVLGFGLEL